MCMFIKILKKRCVSHHTVIVALLLFSMLLARLERMVILPLSLATANRGTLPPVCKCNKKFECFQHQIMIRYILIDQGRANTN